MPCRCFAYVLISALMGWEMIAPWAASRFGPQHPWLVEAGTKHSVEASTYGELVGLTAGAVLGLIASLADESVPLRVLPAFQRWIQMFDRPLWKISWAE